MTQDELAARYRDYAGKCLAVSQAITNAAEKLALIDMAQAWIDLAQLAEKNPHLAVAYETPDSVQPREG